MPTLRFEGYSDDTFGEYAYTNDDHDNCASGEPIEYLVRDPASGCALVVKGQHCPRSCIDWVISVGNHFQPDVGDKPFPHWPMSFVPKDDAISLLIEAPEGVIVRCLTRDES
jgi:hypothetical protein